MQKFCRTFSYPHKNSSTGAACELAEREMAYDHAWIEKLAQRFLDKINSRLSHVIRNGDPKETYLGCINLSFAFVEGEWKHM